MSGETDTSTGETGQSNVAEDSATQQQDTATETATQTTTIESLQADINKVIGINKELIASRDAAKVKVREAEEAAKAQRQGVEGELDAMEQKFNEKFNGVLIDSALDKELTIAGARNVDVAKKLLDRQNISVVNGKADADAIQLAITGLKESESYMFKGDEEDTSKPAATKIARAGEPAQENLYRKDVDATTNIDDLKAVMKKHNILK